MGRDAIAGDVGSQRAAHAYQGQRHRDTDAVEIIERVILLGQIEKGFEKVSDASEKVKFNALLNALDNLSQKFSAVVVIGLYVLFMILLPDALKLPIVV